MSTPLLRCREVRPYLSAYVDGELDPVLQERVEAHLASCAVCGRQVERYWAVDGILGTLPAANPTPEVLDRILAATSRQNSERAVRQSLRRPERPLAPRLLPAFLIADTNLAAPLPRLRNAAYRRRSWIVASALPSLAALLIFAVTLVSFYAQSRHLAEKIATPVPTVSKETEMAKTNQEVAALEPQLPFYPLMPTYYPQGTQLQNAAVGTFADGTKYLDVFWTLAPPFTNLHLREAGIPLAQRANLDYVELEPIVPQNWQLPTYRQWVDMTDLNNSGRLVEGQDFQNFSATLDIGRRGSNLTDYSNYSSTALIYLRLTSLSIGNLYMPLTVASPDFSKVVHFDMLTTGVRDGLTYRWDVYQQSDRVRAALYLNSSNTLLYTDYVNGTQVTRCVPQGSCAHISSKASPSSTDPKLGGRVIAFYGKINPYLRDGELWNMGMIPAPTELGIGNEPVFTLAFDTGPYPMTVYVSAAGRQVVGITSDTESQIHPGGKDAASPLYMPRGSCGQVSYPLIVYLPNKSPLLPNLQAPPSFSGGKAAQIRTVATCTQD